jgi:hypothetical protein
MDLNPIQSKSNAMTMTYQRFPTTLSHDPACRVQEPIPAGSKPMQMFAAQTSTSSKKKTRMNKSKLSLQGVFYSLLFALCILAAPSTWAATYYVRSDGGNASQCNGLSNAAYPGSGTNRNCAWEHPFTALPPGGSPRISGGDTLIIASGSYRMGYGAPGAGSCGASRSGDCFMPPIPSGPSPSQKTRILGAGHNSNCSNPPELWGTERANLVINLRGSSNVELACLEVTDRGNCAEFHCSNGQCSGQVAACKRSSPPFGNWARVGVSARDSSNVVMRDVNIHGLASHGVNAGRISDWTLERVRINANGWAGWDGNVGSNGWNNGTIRFIDSEIAWNGCLENWQTGEIFGCWAQGGGGYGDGLGTTDTGGHWIFDGVDVHHNTSDGIDLLYLRDGGQVTIRRSRIANNAGNQVKSSRRALIENSIIIGNCSWFRGRYNMVESDLCRASGDAVYLGLSNNAQTDLINNTIISEGNCIVSGGGGSSSARLRFLNNLMMAAPRWNNSSRQSCLYYSGSSEQVIWESNFVHRAHNDACPGNSICNGSPGIRNTSINAFDAYPSDGSALISSANASFAPANDYFGNLRGPNGGPDIGAIEFNGAPDQPSDPPSNQPDQIFRNSFQQDGF